MLVEKGKRLPDGVAGAQLRFLQGPGEIGRIERGADDVAAMSMDDAQTPRQERARRVDDVRDERLASKRMQHLGQMGVHALALAGGEDDDVHRKFSGETGKDATMPQRGMGDTWFGACLAPPARFS